MKSISFEDIDLEIIEALQYAPRAPWRLVAEALNTTPTTVARRWDALCSEGLAWSTANLRPGRMAQASLSAYVSIGCETSHKVEVAETLANDARTLSVDITSGKSDIFATILAPNMESLTQYLLERIDQIPGVTNSRPNIANAFFAEGSNWRLGVLSPNQLEKLSLFRIRAATTGASQFTELEKAIALSLGENGRDTYAHLAEAHGTSESSAKRIVNGLINSGAVLIRTDLAAPLAGWPFSIIISADVPPASLENVARTLARLKPVRLCVALAGSPNLKMVAWMRNLEDAHRFETSIAKGIVDLVIADRQIVLRSVKRMGRILDEKGRATTAVPMDIWQ